MASEKESDYNIYLFCLTISISKPNALELYYCPCPSFIHVLTLCIIVKTATEKTELSCHLSLQIHFLQNSIIRINFITVIKAGWQQTCLWSSDAKAVPATFLVLSILSTACWHTRAIISPTTSSHNKLGSSATTILVRVCKARFI